MRNLVDEAGAPIAPSVTFRSYRDGIGTRTYPGTHPTKGAFLTRGTSKDAFARYTEEGGAYVEPSEVVTFHAHLGTPTSRTYSPDNPYPPVH